MNVRIVAQLILVFLVAGCSSTKKREISVGKGAFLKLPPPSEISKPRRVRQLLTISGKGTTRSFEVILDLSPNLLNVVAIGPLGNILFSIEYGKGESKNLKWQAKGPPLNPFIENALADLVVTYAPKSVLLTYFSDGVVILDSDLARSIYVGDQHLVEIIYTQKDRWQGEVTYRHLAHGYQLQIKTLAQL